MLSCSPLSRRDWLRLSAAGVVGFSPSGWFDLFAKDAASHPKRRKSCILLWMNGGPSQMDTFDLKPGHVNGGSYKEIATAVPGIKIGEHLPKLAKHMKDIVLVRSMSTKEGEHVRAAHYMHTGYLPQGPVRYPSMSALVAKELGDLDSDLPNSVSIAPMQRFYAASYSPGFLGPLYAPLVVGDPPRYTFNGSTGKTYNPALKVKNLGLADEVTPEQRDARIELLKGMQRDFVSRHRGVSPVSNETAYARAVRLMRSEAAKAFNFDEEPAVLRDAYGRNQFGQGCLLARRLVERGVPFIEVSHGGVNGEFGSPIAWDTHERGFDILKSLCASLDAGWATLITDLKKRGLLDSTLILWMGEFGRTPRINNGAGRDHYPKAWTTVLAGGGLKSGQVVGKTSKDGTTVEERSVSVPDLLATVCLALGIDPLKENMSNVGRPIRIVEKTAKPIKEIVS
jgi:uncharacterized protein (DUF1501 family)